MNGSRENPYILGMINARGGSRGIPGKNIKPLAGKPLIGYAIETGLAVPGIDRVIVSTDDRAIADVAESFGAEVPFMRPAELASDTSIQIETIHYNVERLEADGPRIDVVVLLQPTSPLREISDVSGCIERLLSSGADTAITVADAGKFNPFGLWRKGTGLELKPFVETPSAGYNRQDMEALYWRTGSVYAMRREVIMERRALYGERVVGHLVDAPRSHFNLDSLFDWELCEAWLAYQSEREERPARS